MHDPNALQASYGVAEVPAHSPDLPIEALRQHDPEDILADRHYLASPCNGAENGDTARHSLDECPGDRTVHGDEILLLVTVLGTQDAVHDVAVVGEQDEAFGILVESADREYACLMAHEIDDILRHIPVRGAFDTGRFVECQVDPRRLCQRRSAVDPHVVTRADLRA
jgi:hypothetical protein